VSQVIDSQNQVSDGIATVSASIESTYEADGQQRTMSYDIAMQQTSDDDRKVMITSHGTFTSQLMVDLKTMTVSTLMNGGVVKTESVPDDQAQAIRESASLGSFIANSNLKTAYAMMRKGASVTDAGTSLDTNKSEVETKDMKIRIKKEFWGKRAVVEYNDRKAENLEMTLDETATKAELGKAETKAGRILKKRFVDRLRKNGKEMARRAAVRRVEKINLENGMVEENEMFNSAGDRIAYMHVSGKKKIKFRRAKSAGRIDAFKLGQTRNAADQIAQPELDTAAPEKEIEIAEETEAEMHGAAGDGKVKSRIKEIKFNEPVKFEWLKKQEGGK
jgi:hypothetical protein